MIILRQLAHVIFLPKLLVNRLRSVLPNIISPLQNTFVSKTNIHDNILIVQAILRSFTNKHKIKDYVAIQLYVKKVYNRLKWFFVKKCLTDLGFYDIWVNWIIE